MERKKREKKRGVVIDFMNEGIKVRRIGTRMEGRKRGAWCDGGTILAERMFLRNMGVSLEIRPSSKQLVLLLLMRMALL